MAATKVFVSYSWSSNEHEEWVLRFATNLRQSGVDAILDKWDLREGHEANAFMEKMVSDPEITKVVIVSDRIYSERSDSRKGGAGTEAQIISKEIFQKEDQNKFVAVVTEKDDNGDPCLPAYYSSRKYIDFSDESRFSESFEQLLRWIADKPFHKKPELGNPPAYLNESENVVSLSTSASKRRAYDAITNLRGQEYPAAKEYFELFTRELEKFRLDPMVDPLTDDMLTNIQSFLPYRDECLDVVRAISRYTKDDRFSDLLHAFFERLARYFEAPEDIGSHKEFAFDNYKFFAYELFLHCGVLFIAEERYDLFNVLIERQYYIERRADFGSDPMVAFTVFRQYLKSLDYRNRQLDLRRYSVAADMLKERAASSGIEFRKIMEVDFIFFLRAGLAANGSYTKWWPETLVYLGFAHRAFEIFERSRSSRYFEKIRPLLGNATKADLEHLIAGYEEAPNTLRMWDGFQIAPDILIGIQNLCTRP
ncbi:MAG: TIR domain-containing protein [Nitrospinae bacterium]|nr:TIR domain-containing protein [Nitrospinota bacterium]